MGKASELVAPMVLAVDLMLRVAFKCSTELGGR